MLNGELSRATLRLFGVTVGAAFGAIWLYRYLVYGNRFILLAFLSGALLAFGALRPATLAYPYRAWMWAGERVGAMISRVILTVCYFGIMTPIALARRLVMRDPLELRFDQTLSSYFHSKRIQPREQFKRMF